jgi:hypothetical protein
LEQLHEIARGSFDQDLRTARADDEIIAEGHPGASEPVHFAVMSSTIRWMRFQPSGPGELVHVLRALIGNVDGVLVAHHPTRTGPDQELVGGEARRRPGCIASPVAESMRPTRVVGAFSPVPWASAAGGRLGLVDLRTGIRERGHSCQWIVTRQEFGGVRRSGQRGRHCEHYR